MTNDFPQSGRRKVSRWAIAAFVCGCLSIFLLPVAGPAAWILAVIAIISIYRHRPMRSGIVLVIAALLVPVAGGAFYYSLYVDWQQDAPPIENDFTAADLRSADAEYDETYHILAGMTETGRGLPWEVSVTGLDAEDVTQQRWIAAEVKQEDYSLAAIRQTILERSEDIEQAWKHIEPARQIIDTLSRYEQIADLSPVTAKGRMAFARPLVFVSRAYQNHIYLQTIRGNYTEAADQLIRFDGVIRKFSQNTRNIPAFLHCCGLLRRDIHTANFLVNDPCLPPQILSRLQKHFQPLDPQTINMRNALIWDYIVFRDAVAEATAEPIPPEYTFRPNSTLRVMRNLCCQLARESTGRHCGQDWIRPWPGWALNVLDVWEDPGRKVTEYYLAYNPFGSQLLETQCSRLVRSRKLEIELRIVDELFQVALKLRGQMTARMSTQHYIDDLQPSLCHVGMDGQAGSEDDIRLAISPELRKLIKVRE